MRCSHRKIFFKKIGNRYKEKATVHKSIAKQKQLVTQFFSWLFFLEVCFEKLRSIFRVTPVLENFHCKCTSLQAETLLKIDFLAGIFLVVLQSVREQLIFRTSFIGLKYIQQSISTWVTLGNNAISSGLKYYSMVFPLQNSFPLQLSVYQIKFELVSLLVY